MLYNIFITLHVIFCLSIIILILMQYGKGAEAGAAFNGSSQSFFGSKGSKNFLVKLTTILTILFFLNCFVIGLLSNKIQSRNVTNLLESKNELLIEKKEILNNGLEDIPIENIKK